MALICCFFGRLEHLRTILEEMDRLSPCRQRAGGIFLGYVFSVGKCELETIFWVQLVQAATNNRSLTNQTGLVGNENPGHLDRPWLIDRRLGCEGFGLSSVRLASGINPATRNR